VRWARIVRAALIQAHAYLPKHEAVGKHVEMIGQAAAQGAQIVCLQESFFGPYFCAQQEPKWFQTAEPDDGPTVTKMRELAREHGLVVIVPFFEKEFPIRDVLSRRPAAESAVPTHSTTRHVAGAGRVRASWAGLVPAVARMAASRPTRSRRTAAPCRRKQQPV
jgi:predicted amidohydrolase